MTRVPELDRALHSVLFLGGAHCVVESNVNYQRVIINNLKKTNKAIFKDWDEKLEGNLPHLLRT